MERPLCAIVVAPELEEWLWHNRASIAKLLSMTTTDLGKKMAEVDGLGSPLLEGSEPPKDRFERVVYSQFKRKPLPEDFERIAETASLLAWQRSPSFRLVVEALRKWFPV